jgi:hypothetical protein
MVLRQLKANSGVGQASHSSCLNTRLSAAHLLSLASLNFHPQATLEAKSHSGQWAVSPCGQHQRILKDRSVPSLSRQFLTHLSVRAWSEQLQVSWLGYPHKPRAERLIITEPSPTASYVLRFRQPKTEETKKFLLKRALRHSGTRASKQPTWVRITLGLS